jgi:hypothetical protein
MRRRFRWHDSPIHTADPHRQCGCAGQVFALQSPCRRQGLAGQMFDQAMSTAQRLAAMNARNAAFWKEQSDEHNRP